MCIAATDSEKVGDDFVIDLVIVANTSAQFTHPSPFCWELVQSTLAKLDFGSVAVAEDCFRRSFVKAEVVLGHFSRVGFQEVVLRLFQKRFFPELSGTKFLLNQPFQMDVVGFARIPLRRAGCNSGESHYDFQGSH